MSELIASISHGVPAALREVATLGRTLAKRSADVLAYFDRPGTSNGPTEAINGRLEHLRGTALGFRNLTNYIARCLLEAGGFSSMTATATTRTFSRRNSILLARPVIDVSMRLGCILTVPGYRGVATCSSASMSRMETSRRPWSSMMPEVESAARRRLRVSGVVPR